MKRTIAMLIAVILVVLSVPCASAELITDGIYTYEIRDGGVIIKSVDKNADGEITVPETLGGYSVTVIGESAFENCKLITKIFLPDGLTSVKRNAFYNCWKLCEITFPDSLTEIEGQYHTFDKVGEDFHFRANMNTYAWQYACDNRIDYVPMSVRPTDDGVLRYNFKDNGAVVEGLCNPYYDGKVVIPETFGGEPVVEIDTAAFYGSSVSTVTLPTSLRNIRSGAFQGCGFLTELVLPDGLVSIEQYAFAECAVLEKLYVPASVTEFGMNVFENCYRLRIFGEENSAIEKYAREYNILFNDDVAPPVELGYKIIGNEVVIIGCDPTCKEITVPEKIFSYPVTAISDGAFKDREYLQSVILPETIETIGDEAFMNCTSLTEIVIPDCVRTIGNAAFRGCTALERAYFGTVVKEIGDDSFEGCENVTFYLYDYPSVVREFAIEKNIPYESRPLPQRVAGDVSCDGKVNLSDVTLLLKYIAGWDILLEAMYCDVTGDGSINLSDVTLLLKYIAGWNVTLG